jgi:hypothetical protein
MPIGFCCENCFLYDKYTTCLKSKNKSEEEDKPGTGNIKDLKLVNATIEEDLLKVTLSQKDGEEKTIYIDLKKHLSL